MSTDKQYDVVIVGGGWAGATMAKQLGKAGKKVLILEAGDPLKSKNREVYMEHFFNAMAKVPSAPYPQNYNAPRPSVLDINNFDISNPDAEGKDCSNPIKSIRENGYFIQKGPLPFGSTNERVAGGTSWHWLGTCLRLVPNDFKMKSVYNVGVDWPITYDELSPYYDEAEYFIGVAGDVSAQDGLHGITYPEGYNYPMQAIPPSVLDQYFGEKLNGEPMDDNTIQVVSTPAGRNGISNRNWKTGEIYDNGRRLCQGNTNCTPICPIQAKYDATVTLSEALNTGNVDIMYKTVAYEVLMDEDTKEINGIRYKQYETKDGPVTGSGVINTGTKYVVAAHAIEAAKLFLMSKSQMPEGIANSSGQMGKNLMDHPVYLSWGSTPDPKYPFRGPLSTSGIETVKDGAYRDKRAAYRIEIGNEGWNWPTGAPYTQLIDMVEGGTFGQDLINNIQTDFTKQFRIGFLIEQTPEPTSYIIPSPDCKDNLGIPRPQLHYDFSEYTMAGFQAAREATNFMFGKLGATDATITNSDEVKKAFPSTWFDYNGQTYNFYGAGHIMGTHRMGDNAADSVTDANMKSWDHSNLYIVGCGSFPTGATSNPTLTLVALALKASEAILAELG